MKIHALTGEFVQAVHETAFLGHKLPETRALLGFTLIFCTLFYFAFTVSDLMAVGYGATFLRLSAARLVVVITAGICAWLAYRRPLSVRATWIVASLAEAVALSCFMIIAVERPAEFHWHAMSLAIMITVIYLYIPNSFTNTFLLASGATGVFLVLAGKYGRLTAADEVTLMMLLALANAFGALAAQRFNRVSREEYAARVQFQDAAARDHLTGCFNRRYLHDTLMQPA